MKYFLCSLSPFGGFKKGSSNSFMLSVFEDPTKLLLIQYQIQRRHSVKYLVSLVPYIFFTRHMRSYHFSSKVMAINILDL